MKARIEDHKRAVMKADPSNTITEHVWRLVQKDDQRSIAH